MPKFDLVTVCFTEELRLLQLQARSLSMYAEPTLFGEIIVLVNERKPKHFKRQFKKRVLPEYGDWASRVRVVEAAEVCADIHDIQSGWRSQQLLKLMVAQHISADRFIVLDAKNHFIRPVCTSDFLSDTGVVRVNMYGVHGPFESGLRTAYQLFGGTDDLDLAQILPTTTPFVFYRQYLLDMMEELQARVRKPFPLAFRETECVEFYLYTAYLLARFNTLGDLYEHRVGGAVTVFPVFANDPDRCADLFTRLDNEATFCMGTHRRVFEAQKPEAMAMVYGAWKRFQLVETEIEQQYFSHLEPRPAVEKLGKVWSKLLT